MNSVRNGYEASGVVNEVHRLHNNISMFGLISDNETNIYSDHSSAYNLYFFLPL